MKWINPWADESVYIDVEELAECHIGCGGLCNFGDGVIREMTKEDILRIWRSPGRRLEGYIIRSIWDGREHYYMGVRFGDEPHEYYSPLGDQEKLRILFHKYRDLS